MRRVVRLIWQYASIFFSFMVLHASADLNPSGITFFTLLSVEGEVIQGTKKKSADHNYVILSTKKAEKDVTWGSFNADIGPECQHFLSGLVHENYRPITNEHLDDLTSLLTDSGLNLFELPLPASFFIHEVSDLPLLVTSIEVLTQNEFLIKGTINAKPVTVKFFVHKEHLCIKLYAGHWASMDIRIAKPELVYTEAFILMEEKPNNDHLYQIIETIIIKMPQMTALSVALCSAFMDHPMYSLLFLFTATMM